MRRMELVRLKSICYNSLLKKVITRMLKSIWPSQTSCRRMSSAYILCTPEQGKDKLLFAEIWRVNLYNSTPKEVRGLAAYFGKAYYIAVSLSVVYAPFRLCLLTQITKRALN